MRVKIRFGLMVWMALVGSGVAACSGADVPSEDPAGSQQEELGAGKLCAGPGELTCPDGQYCAGGLGKCPGEAQFGRCAARPDACTNVYKPVCGCDGETYGNACQAAAVGVSIASQGECAHRPAFCGGIAGIPCPDGQACIDDPSDDCDPKRGGADCGGICVE